MKKVLILTVLLLSVLVMGFAIGEQEEGGTQTGSGGSLSGTYRCSATAYITFTGSNFSGRWGANSAFSGTYSVSGSRLTLNITGGRYAGNTWRWTVANANTLRDQDGDSWNKEGGGTQTDTNWVASNGPFPSAWFAPLRGSSSTHWYSDNPLTTPQEFPGSIFYLSLQNSRPSEIDFNMSDVSRFRITSMTTNGQGIRVRFVSGNTVTGDEITLCTGWTVRNGRLTLTGATGPFSRFNGKALLNFSY